VAAYFGHPACIAHLLKFGAEVDSLDSYGGTPLVAAALNGEVECVQVLLEANAKVDHATNNMNTPLMKAALNGNVACVRVLLGMGAEADRVNKSHKSAKDLAKESLDDERGRLERLEKEPEPEKIIEKRRRHETKNRLKKVIEDHEKVLADLDKSAAEVKQQYDYLFPTSSDSSAQKSPEDVTPINAGANML
jgi:ankyrin repeat protein